MTDTGCNHPLKKITNLTSLSTKPPTKLSQTDKCVGPKTMVRMKPEIFYKMSRNMTRRWFIFLFFFVHQNFQSFYVFFSFYFNIEIIYTFIYTCIVDLERRPPATADETPATLLLVERVLRKRESQQ